MRRDDGNSNDDIEKCDDKRIENAWRRQNGEYRIDNFK